MKQPLSSPLVRQKGFLLLAAVILLIIFSGIGIILTRMITEEVHTSNQQADSFDAFYIANAGLEVGLNAVTTPTFGNRVACQDLSTSYSNVSFGDGVYSLTGVKYAPTTQITLTSAISVSSTILPVSSLTGLAPYGNILIDQELMTYRGTSTNSTDCGGNAPCLTSVKRGVGVTQAASHVLGSVVSQNQCMITATAGVPDLANPKAKRTLSANALQMEEGWAVGNTSNGGETIGFWDGHSWFARPPDANLPNNRISSIAALSYSDIWVVGNSGLFFHWNGATWQAGNIQSSGSNKVSQDHFNDIHCNNTSDCWAVGDKHASDAFLARWDGTIWSGVAASAVNENLHGISCVSPTDCWAVGNNRTFLHWDGTTWSLGNVDSSMPVAAINAVSCGNSTHCWAVGNSGTFAYWNGNIWSPVTASNVGTANLTNIDCTSSNNCWAVGQNSTYALLVHWDGSSWQRIPSADLINVPDADLSGISCAKADNCWASGVNGTMLHYDGSNWNGSTPNSLPTTTINDVNLIASEEPQVLGLWQQN